MLFRITPPEKRPLVFSLRQTGNQSGAIIGSLCLPVLAAYDPVYGYAAIMLLAVVAIVAFERLRPTYDPLVRGAASTIRLREAMKVLVAQPEMRKLAIASVPFSALQIALNTFLVTYAVGRLGLSLIAAGMLLATAQAGGLAGRLLFGLVATRFLPAWTTVIALGFAMSLCAAVMALAQPAWSWPLLLAVAFAFGVTASGWNGVFLAEVARLAPEGRVGEATGAVLMFGFAGLVLGPLVDGGCRGGRESQCCLRPARTGDADRHARTDGQASLELRPGGADRASSEIPPGALPPAHRSSPACGRNPESARARRASASLAFTG